MNRPLATILVIAVIGVCAFVYLNQPEPTPAERIEEAAREAGEAIGDAVSSAASGVSEQASATTQQLSDAAGDAADTVSRSIVSLNETGTALLQSWQETGILTKDGFDYDKLVAAVDSSGLDESTREKVLRILTEIRSAPEAFSEKLQELQALFAG